MAGDAVVHYMMIYSSVMLYCHLYRSRSFMMFRMGNTLLLVHNCGLRNYGSCSTTSDDGNVLYDVDGMLCNGGGNIPCDVDGIPYDVDDVRYDDDGVDGVCPHRFRHEPVPSPDSYQLR